MNIPEVKLGIIAVSRDCFPIALSTQRRKNIVAAYGEGIYECPITVENEKDAQAALADVRANGVNALVVFLGNFGPETPETLLCQKFHGPVMYVAAAEGDGDMINGRGDAYCGVLNCSYNLGMRHLKAYIPEYPVGTAEECAQMIREFVPIARAIIGVKSLKIITFGPRPQDFFACNAPIKGLYELGVEIEENSELDLLVSYKEHANDPRIPEVCADMAAEMGEGRFYPELSERMAQFELTLLDWAENHKGARQYVAFADKCWPAFPEQFGFEPCYVNSRLASRGIPVACEVDIYGALSEYIGACITGDAVTLLDINNSVPKYIYDEDIAGKFDYKLTDTFMGFHCGNTLLQDVRGSRCKVPADSNRLLSRKARATHPAPWRRHCGQPHHLLPPAVQRGRWRSTRQGECWTCPPAPSAASCVRHQAWAASTSRAGAEALSHHGAVRRPLREALSRSSISGVKDIATSAPSLPSTETHGGDGQCRGRHAMG